MSIKVLLCIEVVIAIITAVSSFWAYKLRGIDYAGDILTYGVIGILSVSTLISYIHMNEARSQSEDVDND